MSETSQDEMRHPRTFKFLAWTVTSVAVAAGALATLVAALAPTYQGVKVWGEQSFYAIQLMLNDPWFIGPACALLALYVLATLWCYLPERSGYQLSGRNLAGLGRVMNGPDAVGLADQSDVTAEQETGSPIVFAGIEAAEHTPANNHTALRVRVRNQTGATLTGLIARLVAADPNLGSLQGPINLPLVLETKARLDLYRNPHIHQAFPHHGFDLHAHSETLVEVVWLHSHGALEGHVTHEAGETEFLFVGSQDLRVEVTGAGPPIVAVLRINVADDDQQSWTPELIVEAAAHTHGQVGFG